MTPTNTPTTHTTTHTHHTRIPNPDPYHTVTPRAESYQHERRVGVGGGGDHRTSGSRHTGECRG